jgi:regulator of ribosome biosynthesis
MNFVCIRANPSAYLQQEARENVQLLLSKLFVLPTQRLDSSGVLATLPAPTMRIPREKPIPKAKALTKWEEYAQLKGIQKKKKGRMVFDEDFGEWRPRWGYKRANNTLDKDNWVVEQKGTLSMSLNYSTRERERERESQSSNASDSSSV